MNHVPIIPESAPFTIEQRSWLNGFLAGILSKGEVGATQTNESIKQLKLLIAFASQSGNAESIAKKLNKQAIAKGIASKVLGLDAIHAEQLAKEPNLLFITSTWEDGEMPDNAADFWKRLNQNDSSPRFEQINYSVLALGDKNYGDTFCQAGRELDERLAQLGAKRIYPRVDCDVDFEDDASRWSEQVFKLLLNDDATTATADAEEIAKGYTRKNP